MTSTWTDWSGQQWCMPKRHERPADEAGVAGAVRRAAADGLVVRPVGAGHSFTPLCVTDGVQLDLSRLHRLLGVDADGVARVQAGMTLRELSLALHARGRALEILGDIDRQAVAGALATATHGTGAAFGNLSVLMVGGRLVTADGSVRDLADPAQPDLLPAARVSLGALGVLTEVLLRTVPAFRLHKREEQRPLRDVLDRLDELAVSADHVDVYAVPWSSRALVMASQRTDEPAAPPAALRTWINDDLLANTALGLIQRTGRRFPGTHPVLGRVTGAAISRSTRLDHSHRVFSTERKILFTESEWALPRAAAREAVESVMSLIERRRLPVSFPIELRFAAGDDALLSTAYGRDTAYLAVHQYVGSDWAPYFRAVEEVMLDLDGRPHWAKRHEAASAVLAPRYPGWQRFGDVRARLDPDGVFVNDHLARTLGVTRDRGRSSA
ncbi:MAG TPA: D-arabinono-1,4-lactone oxidase [Actinomycetes bacterium]